MKELQHENSSRRLPAYEGAKFDISGYCLKHSKVRLSKLKCYDSNNIYCEDILASTAYTTIRKACPMCGEHGLTKPSKTKDTAHGYSKPRSSPKDVSRHPTLRASLNNFDSIESTGEKAPDLPFKGKRSDAMKRYVKEFRDTHAKVVTAKESRGSIVEDKKVSFFDSTTYERKESVPLLSRRHSSDMVKVLDESTLKTLARRNSCGDGSKFFSYGNTDKKPKSNVGLSVTKSKSFRRCSMQKEIDQKMNSSSKKVLKSVKPDADKAKGKKLKKKASSGKGTVVEASSTRYDMPWNSSTGCCNFHPGVVLAQKGAGGWKLLREECPECSV